MKSICFELDANNQKYQFVKMSLRGNKKQTQTVQQSDSLWRLIKVVPADTMRILIKVLQIQTSHILFLVFQEYKFQRLQVNMKLISKHKSQQELRNKNQIKRENNNRLKNKIKLLKFSNKQNQWIYASQENFLRPWIKTYWRLKQRKRKS
ncbi:unnamed protein product [Paramecium sonneborni]|uniref:Uncharacterized protein n=1 Tax=Paramecium sonneborni TaxID=65129 RepID=A0A8S1RVD6_9CILI|nr:unnamed protein product [Paramecium sonneborni]